MVSAQIQENVERVVERENRKNVQGPPSSFHTHTHTGHIITFTQGHTLLSHTLLSQTGGR